MSINNKHVATTWCQLSIIQIIHSFSTCIVIWNGVKPYKWAQLNHKNGNISLLRGHYKCGTIVVTMKYALFINLWDPCFRLIKYIRVRFLDMGTTFYRKWPRVANIISVNLLTSSHVPRHLIHSCLHRTISRYTRQLKLTFVLIINIFVWCKLLDRHEDTPAQL